MVTNETTEKLSGTQRRFVSEKVLSSVTGRSVKTLQKDRIYGKGPFPHYRVGSQVLYDVAECIGIISASRSTVVDSAA